MPLTLELSDIQSELNVCLSVKKKSAPESEDADAEVSGRSLPCEKTSSKDGGFISAMSVKDPVYKNVGPMAHKYLSTKVDFPYGIHYEKQTGDYRVGHSSVKLVGDDLIINFKGKEKTFKGTEGLWRLLTQDMNYFDENDYFSEKDWETYMKILLITNEELAVRDPDEIPKEELLTEKGETIQISTFCREARYVKEIDELLRRLVDLQKVGLGSKVYCGYTQTCLLFWITSRLVGTIGALNKKTEKLIEWIKLNKKLIEESELLDLVFSGLPFGFNYKTNPICTPRSSSGTRIYTNRQITKMKPQDSDCKAHDKRYQHYLAGDKDLIADAKEGMVNLQEIFISDPSYFEQFDISKKITGKKLNMALQKGLYFLQSYYSG